MKKLLSIFIMLFYSMALFAQIQLERSVVASSGSYAAASGIQLDQTLGELAVSTFSSSGLILTQGYHQPEPQTVGIIESEILIELNVYPNPFLYNFNIDIMMDEDIEILISIYDILGKIILSKKHDLTSGIRSTLSFDNVIQNPGVYILDIKETKTSRSIVDKALIKL